MAFLISPNLPANVLEIGNEITQAKIDEINAGTLATQTWVNSQGFLTSAVTSDKALANAIACSIWYNYDTGSDWNRNTGITNSYILGGSILSCGITDGTTFVTGFPSVVSSLASNADWKVSVNGTLSDFSIMYQIV